MATAYIVIGVLFIAAICAINRKHTVWEHNLQENREEFDRAHEGYLAWLADHYGDSEDD